MKMNVEKSYKISGIVLAIMTIIIFNIMFINEDESWRIIPFIFAAIVYGLSYPSSIISKKFIKIGNKIKSNFLRILYYIFILPFFSIILFAVLCFFISLYTRTLETPNEIGAALGQALMMLFVLVVIFICIILPYIQTLIVLILNFFRKK